MCVYWVFYSAAAPNLKGVVMHMAVVHTHDPRFHVCHSIEDVLEGCASYTVKELKYLISPWIVTLN